MKITYSDGSFMLSWDKIRAWFNADGTLKDAEYKRKHAVAVSATHTKVREWLSKQGANELRNPNHAKAINSVETVSFADSVNTTHVIDIESK